MKLTFICLLFVVARPTLIFGDDSDDVQISGTNDKCAEFCSKTYPAHTYDHSGAEQSCKQGCRLYSVIQFADKMKSSLADGQATDQVNSTAIFAACNKECGEAYSDEIFKRACLDGCQHQTPVTTGQVRVVIDDSSPLFPFANKLINEAMEKFGDMKNEMKSQWDNFRKWFKTDDQPETTSDGGDEAKIVSSLQNMGEGLLNLFRGLNPGDQNQKSNQEQQKPKLFGGLEDVTDHLPNRGVNISEKPLVAKEHPKHEEGSEFMGPASVGNLDENGEPIIIVQMIPVETDLDDNADANVGKEPSPPPSGDVIYADADDGWLACLARRTQNLSMLSRWLLCLALMLSILCMFWLCLALLRTQRQRRRRLYTQYRAGKSDVVYFTPPPAYEKSPSSAAYLPLNKDDLKTPPTPPPAYEAAMETVKTEIPKTETA